MDEKIDRRILRTLCKQSENDGTRMGLESLVHQRDEKYDKRSHGGR